MKMTIQQTSILSWIDLQESVGWRQKLVFDAINYLGECTDREIMQYLGFSDMNTVRPRRNELYHKGFIVCCGKRPCAVTGKEVMLWKLNSNYRKVITK